MNDLIRLHPGKQYNCPNCAAPLTYDEVCSYCGTRIEWVPMISTTINVLPKKIIPICMERRYRYRDKELLLGSETENYLENSMREQLGLEACKFVTIERQVDKHNNDLVYKGTIFICDGQ